MPRLFNLQSYFDACEYTFLVKEESDIVPQSSRDYKLFLDKYSNYPYLTAPIGNNFLASELTINSQELNFLSMGTELSGGDRERLFIISDTLDLMTLSMRYGLGSKDGYLYSSAYHYWSHREAILERHLHNPSPKPFKPLVFIDFDSFDISTLVPVTFTQPENSPYQIPILDTRHQISLPSVCNSQTTYLRVCYSIAEFFLQQQFPQLATNQESINHLGDYLRKINFFRFVQSQIGQESISLIIEVYHDHQIFYKRITVLILDIANIVYQQIQPDINLVNQLTTQYPQYQFVLISQYNIFEKISYLHLSNFICFTPQIQRFSEIWIQKNQLGFPLFGIYLDRIEFAIAIDGQEVWIELSDERDAISYEGKLTVLTGRIASRDQDFVKIPRGRNSANLPIRVNGSDYSINGVPQDYRIDIENYHNHHSNQNDQEVLVQILFYLQPGSFPRLEVKDLQNQYTIKTSLVNRVNVSYSYIPPSRISENRQQRSLSQIRRLNASVALGNFMNSLNQISQLNVINSRTYEQLSTSFRQAYQHLGHRQNPDLLQFIEVSSIEDEEIVTGLKRKLTNSQFDRVIDFMITTTNQYLRHNRPVSYHQKNLLTNAIILTGKLYQFSQFICSRDMSDSLFSDSQVKLIIDNSGRDKNVSNEYLQCLSRIAVTEQLQQRYFQLFDLQYTSETSQYLWGYGRILLWYYDFNNPSNTLLTSRLYLEHFTKIINYLLTRHYGDFEFQYKQNAFLSLIYLLTFCAYDANFCHPNSAEFHLALRVIDKFQNDRIILKTISSERPLNHYFQELIEGRSTEDGIANLLQG
ncbi:hypothetical protein [Cylindrospermopsis curvispora]|uniref:Uncharacterized protein n=1 Tax=Cylindrospermopsis curvispora GIHE-G1 TaxID=2666332 RepID=A0A7H0F0F8_9CYAN|nr:hypothetical protein [Cylindrospermopsis curvispora]QNP29524.1 hypothetical protein IAR63_17200 [Cylindrospermopsis curvispora GIHE-G1]